MTGDSPTEQEMGKQSLFLTHPEIDEITKKGFDPSEVIALAGYLGAAPREGVVRLHPSMNDFSVSLDIAASDILSTADAPVSTMPMGGTILWVSRTAAVTLRRTRTVAAVAQQVRGLFPTAAAMEQPSPPDRLQIRVPSANAGVPPVYQPPKNPPCTSCHLVPCTSHCYQCMSGG